MTEGAKAGGATAGGSRVGHSSQPPVSATTATAAISAQLQRDTRGDPRPLGVDRFSLIVASSSTGRGILASP
jgi:hypothetical protein